MGISNLKIILWLTLATNLLSSCATVKPLDTEISHGGRAVSVTICPNNSDIQIVASESGGLFRTKDGGTHWSHVSGILNFRFKDVSFIPWNSNLVIACAKDDWKEQGGGGIYMSTNQGKDWHPMKMNPKANDLSAYSISFDQANKKIWMGTSNGIYASLDDGKNWEEVQNSTFSSVRTDGKPIFNVLVIGQDSLVLTLENKICISFDGGNNWLDRTGTMPFRVSHELNQIATSPISSHHLFCVIWGQGLFYSIDFGANWTVLLTDNAMNRPPFVSTTNAYRCSDNLCFDIYYGNGSCSFRKTRATYQDSLTFQAWSTISVDHCDVSAIGFDRNGIDPLTVLSDGGVHLYNQLESKWKMIGSGSTGYNALQVYEITGSDLSSSTDLYFGTQDNRLWASSDLGKSWPKVYGSEGFALQVRPFAYDGERSIEVAGVNCGPCHNFKAGRLYKDPDYWNNAPRFRTPPVLYETQSAKYIQPQYTQDSTAFNFAISHNGDQFWRSKSAKSIGTPYHLAKTAKQLTHGGNFVFQAIKMADQTNRKLDKIVLSKYDINYDLLSIISKPSVTLGIVGNQFSWYPVFGVDPLDANFIIMVDVENDRILRSQSGGLFWFEDRTLKRMITNDGLLNFSEGQFSQISSIAINRHCREHIVVGTNQNGLFESHDRGVTWEKVPGSEVVPFITSIFFSVQGEVLVSSYGRGVWKYSTKCKADERLKEILASQRNPTPSTALWYKGNFMPLINFNMQRDCENCNVYLTDQGYINEIQVDSVSEHILNVELSSGSINKYTLSGGNAAPYNPFTNRKNANLTIRPPYLHDSIHVVGFFQDSNRYRGLILSDRALSFSDLFVDTPIHPNIILLESEGLGGSFIRNKDSISVLCTGFDSSLPIEVFLDNNPIYLSLEPVLDKNSNYHIRLPVSIFRKRISKLVVRQRDKSKALEAVMEIIIGT